MPEPTSEAGRVATTDELLDKDILEGMIRQHEQGQQLSPRDEALLLVVSQLLRQGEKPQPSQIDSLVAEIDRKLSKQVDAIVHDPDFQKMESTWKSLFYLV